MASLYRTFYNKLDLGSPKKEKSVRPDLSVVSNSGMSGNNKDALEREGPKAIFFSDNAAQIQNTRSD